MGQTPKDRENFGENKNAMPPNVRAEKADGKIIIRVDSPLEKAGQLLEIDSPMRRYAEKKDRQRQRGKVDVDKLAAVEGRKAALRREKVAKKKKQERLARAEQKKQERREALLEVHGATQDGGMERRRKHRPYLIMMLIYGLFVVFAFVIDTPGEIWQGTKTILQSQGVLLSDYMAIGGVGATLINAALIGSFSILVHMAVKVRPNGATIMAMWLSTGFAMFGKNLLNMIPLTFGAWLYAKVKNEPFRNFTLASLLSATLAPVVGGIAFNEMLPPIFSVPLGLAVGTLVGFIFPAVSQFTVRVHGGYNLYNMGFAGGLIATFIVSAFNAVGVPMNTEMHWHQGNTFELAFLLYMIFIGLMVYGVFGNGELKWPNYREIMENSGRLVSDYLVMYGNATYFNMGLLGAVATTLMISFGADLNGATICGIFTIVGFGAFGKHMRNVVPLFIGAILSAFANKLDPRAPVNLLAILFSTGLAPIAGQFGPVWGMIAGFLHVNTITHIGFLNSGLNLYNNGYAAGFVALFLVPIINAFHKSDRRFWL